MNKSLAERSSTIKRLALKYGFARVGLSRADELTDQKNRLAEWLNLGYHGQMHYMANHFEMRVDPRELVPGAKSVISLAYNYYSSVQISDPNTYKVSKYAYGKDYHGVIKAKLKQLLDELISIIGSVNARVFVDSAPVLERDWAVRSGIGWMGKNTLLIHPRMGSYFFLAEIISDIEVEPDYPMQDFCGTCTRCIDACPTSAILPGGYVVDGSKCISYATIELKSTEDIPDTFKGKMHDWIFGCDICQEVCPWNKFSKQHEEPAFEPTSDFIHWSKQKWMDMDEELFRVSFRKSALKRAKFTGVKRNLLFNNS